MIFYFIYVPLQRIPSYPKAQAHTTPLSGLPLQVPPFRQGRSLQVRFPLTVGNDNMNYYINISTHMTTQIIFDIWGYREPATRGQVTCMNTNTYARPHFINK